MQNRRLLSALHVSFWLFPILIFLHFSHILIPLHGRNDRCWASVCRETETWGETRKEGKWNKRKKQSRGRLRSKFANLRQLSILKNWSIDVFIFGVNESENLLRLSDECGMSFWIRFESTADRRWNISLPVHLLRRLNLACFHTNSVLHCRPICARPADELRRKIVSFIFNYFWHLNLITCLIYFPLRGRVGSSRGLVFVNN